MCRLNPAGDPRRRLATPVVWTFRTTGLPGVAEPLPALLRPAWVTRTILASLVLGTVLAACGADTVPPSTSGPITLPSPIREARTVPQPDGSIRLEAVSARVAPGRPYIYPAFTHCGFAPNTFDFDGSFWAIVDAPAAFAAEGNLGNPPAGIDNPIDRGVIVLVGADSATWTSRGGAVLGLARGPNEVKTFGCD
jgi:hypothetical protein